MNSNRFCLALAVATPLILVALAWAVGMLPLLDAWRWKVALVIDTDPLALALMFFASLLAVGKAMDLIRARYASQDLQHRH